MRIGTGGMTRADHAGPEGFCDPVVNVRRKGVEPALIHARSNVTEATRSLGIIRTNNDPQLPQKSVQG